MAPVFVFVGVQLAEIVAENVGQAAAPAVAAVVGVETVANGLVGRALHIHVERGVHAQTAFVDRFSAVSEFEVLANFLKEVRREIVARILEVKTERGIHGGPFFGGRDLAFFRHATQDEIAAGERAGGVGDGRIDGSADHAGEERSL